MYNVNTSYCCFVGYTRPPPLVGAQVGTDVDLAPLERNVSTFDIGRRFCEAAYRIEVGIGERFSSNEFVEHNFGFSCVSEPESVGAIRDSCSVIRISITT